LNAVSVDGAAASEAMKVSMEDPVIVQW